MPRRKELLVTNEIYHVYNRSAWNQDLFSTKRHFNRIRELINYYHLENTLRLSKYKQLSSEFKKEYIASVKNKPPLIKLYAYAIMPDHYHLLVKQIRDNGIKDFVSNFQNAFAKYFNIRNQNRGSLFINPFKAKNVDSEEILLHVSRYIHLNPVTSYLFEFDKLGSNELTSYPCYIGKANDDLVSTELILKIAGSRKNYEEFVGNQVDYQRKLKMIKKFLMD